MNWIGRTIPHDDVIVGECLNSRSAQRVTGNRGSQPILQRRPTRLQLGRVSCIIIGLTADVINSRFATINRRLDLPLIFKLLELTPSIHGVLKSDLLIQRIARVQNLNFSFVELIRDPKHSETDWQSSISRVVSIVTDNSNVSSSRTTCAHRIGIHRSIIMSNNGQISNRHRISSASSVTGQTDYGL